MTAYVLCPSGGKVWSPLIEWRKLGCNKHFHFLSSILRRHRRDTLAALVVGPRFGGRVRSHGLLVLPDVECSWTYKVEDLLVPFNFFAVLTLSYLALASRQYYCAKLYGLNADVLTGFNARLQIGISATNLVVKEHLALGS